MSSPEKRFESSKRFKQQRRIVNTPTNNAGFRTNNDENIRRSPKNAEKPSLREIMESSPNRLQKFEKMYKKPISMTSPRGNEENEKERFSILKSLENLFGGAKKVV